MDTIDIDENTLIQQSIEFHRLDTDSEHSIYELILRGYKRKPGSNIWEKRINDPNRYNMSDDAVYFIMASRLALVNKSVIQGSLTGQNKWKLFDEVILNFMNAFDEQLTVKGDSYNLSVSECTMISEEEEEYLRMILTRTINDGERKRDKSNEKLVDDEDENKKLFK